MANEKKESTTGWKISGDQATYCSETFTTSLTLKQPGQGLKETAIDGAPVTVSPLQISPEPPTPPAGETVVEAYVRGRDLIVTYAQTPARTARPQVYWSFIDDGAIQGIQATVGMQTSLLDSDPTIRTSTKLGKGTLQQLGADEKWITLASSDKASTDNASVFLFRPADADWSYIEALYPTDFQGATVGGSEENLEIQFELFPEFLEKGVIRKGRIQSLFVPRKNDEELAVEALKRLAESSAPLTT